MPYKVVNQNHKKNKLFNRVSRVCEQLSIPKFTENGKDSRKGEKSIPFTINFYDVGQLIISGDNKLWVV